eukprot:scaffold582_cov385-Prasinococcus_capsulatus_cf.AAC.46
MPLLYGGRAAAREGGCPQWGQPRLHIRLARPPCRRATQIGDHARHSLSLCLSLYRARAHARAPPSLPRSGRVGERGERLPRPLRLRRGTRAKKQRSAATWQRAASGAGARRGHAQDDELSAFALPGAPSKVSGVSRLPLAAERPRKRWMASARPAWREERRCLSPLRPRQSRRLLEETCGSAHVGPAWAPGAAGSASSPCKMMPTPPCITVDKLGLDFPLRWTCRPLPHPHGVRSERWRLPLESPTSDTNARPGSDTAVPKSSHARASIQVRVARQTSAVPSCSRPRLGIGTRSSLAGTETTAHPRCKREAWLAQHDARIKSVCHTANRSCGGYWRGGPEELHSSPSVRGLCGQLQHESAPVGRAG